MVVSHRQSRLVAPRVQPDEQLVQGVQLAAQAHVRWQLVRRQQRLCAVWVQPAAEKEIASWKTGTTTL